MGKNVTVLRGTSYHFSFRSQQDVMIGCVTPWPTQCGFVHNTVISIKVQRQ